MKKNDFGNKLEAIKCTINLTLSGNGKYRTLFKTTRCCLAGGGNGANVRLHL